MKKITPFLLLAFTLVFSTSVLAQSTVTGTVVGSELNASLPGANVLEKGTNNGVSTDFDGNFSLTSENTSGEIVITYVGYSPMTLSFNGNTNLGNIALLPDNSLDEIVVIGSGVIDLADDRQTPVAVSTIRAAEIQEKAIGNVELAQVVKNTPSAYISGDTGFGDSQLYLRGFDQTNIAVLLNGQPVNGMEDGRVYWSNWAGMADIANAVQVQRGLGSSKLAISSVGGTMNIVMKSTDRNKGGFVRLLGGNDSYFKGTVSYDTGLSDSGWSFSVLLDHWQAHRKWAYGTFGEGQTYFASVGYKPNDKHAFNFLVTGAPQMHGNKWSQSISTLERDPKFNQHWGYTSDASNGQYRSDIESERTNYYHKPVLNLNWDWNISDKSELSTVVYASWGRGGGTGNRGNSRIRTADGQLDYLAIEQQNMADNNGIGNESGDDSYIRRSSVNNHSWYGLITNFSTDLTENINLNVGADLRFYTGDHFRQITDLYGLDGWANDRSDGAVVSSTFDAKPWSALSNFADERERIDYDYSEDINYQGVFGQLEYANQNFTAFLQGAVSNQTYQRDGRMDGNGKSSKIDKQGFNIKGGTSYAFDDYSKVYANVGYYSRQPFLDNIFTNIRNSNELVQPEIDNEDIFGIEFGYRFQQDNFYFGVDYYRTDWDNRVILNSGEQDGVDVNIFDRGTRQLHSGLETEARYQITKDLNLKGYFSAGRWEFKGTAMRSLYDDETGALVSSNQIDLEDVKVTTAPQFTAGLGFKFDLSNKWSIDSDLNYYDQHWIQDIDFDSGNLQTNNVGTLDEFFLWDAGLTFKFKIGDNNATFRTNVYNITDRIELNQTDPFGYFVTNGTTYNTSLKYSF